MTKIFTNPASNEKAKDVLEARTFNDIKNKFPNKINDNITVKDLYFGGDTYSTTPKTPKASLYTNPYLIKTP